MTALDVGDKEVAVAVAGLLGRSEATLTRLDVRCAKRREIETISRN